jgi:hypothetical protein
LAINQLRSVVRTDAVHKCDRVATSDVDLAHMRDVKQAGMQSRAQMLFNRARRVLNRHIPSAEIHHPATHLTVDGV